MNRITRLAPRDCKTARGASLLAGLAAAAILTASASSTRSAAKPVRAAYLSYAVVGHCKTAALFLLRFCSAAS